MVTFVSFLLSLTFSKMRLGMFKYLALFKYTPMSKWQRENLLKASFNLSFTAQTTAKTIKFLLNNIAPLNKQLHSKLLINFKGYVLSNLTRKTLTCKMVMLFAFAI